LTKSCDEQSFSLPPLFCFTCQASAHHLKVVSCLFHNFVVMRIGMVDNDSV
jgi:hypothetical protein